MENPDIDTVVEKAIKTASVATPVPITPEDGEEAHKLYIKNLGEFLSSEEENNSSLTPLLKKVANKYKTYLLAFIAPVARKRVSPSEKKGAAIRQWEELGIEESISQIKKNTSRFESSQKKLFLLINSPGGSPSSSYIIANILRNTFSNITVFVPDLAASGGTLLALAGNEIVMSQISKLSPIDTQISYKGELVSAQSMRRALETFDDYFEKKLPWEVPYPRKNMAEKFDPILFEEWEAELNQIYFYAKRLLRKAGYPANIVNSLAFNLIFSPFPHNFVIDRERADSLNLNVKKSEEYQDVWEILKSWYSLYILKAEDKHIIRYILPDGG